jgi:hypothetical protein
MYVPIVDESVMVKVGLVETACIDGLQSALVTVHSELARRRAEDRAPGLVKVVDGLVLDILVANVVYPERAHMATPVGSRDFGQWREKQGV